jgi:hypothetical protein
MRKIHAVFLAGAVVLGLGAIAGLAAFAPSLVGQKSATHEMTVQIPGGGSVTIAYAGNVAPKVTFHNRQFAAPWPGIPAFGWTMPSVMELDPFIADMHRHLDMWARTPLVMPIVPHQPLNAATFGSLPYGTSYSVVSNGDGFCARFTQITKAVADARPKVVSRTSGNCGTDSSKAANFQPSQAAKPLNLPRLITPATTQSM